MRRCEGIWLRRRRRLTTACTRPRISVPLIVNLSVAQLDARRVMPGVRPLSRTQACQTGRHRLDCRHVSFALTPTPHMPGEVEALAGGVAQLVEQRAYTP